MRTRSTSASRSIRGYGTKLMTVKWSIGVFELPNAVERISKGTKAVADQAWGVGGGGFGFSGPPPSP